MDTRFVASLLAIVEEGSIAAAARRAGVTASALSQRVAALEGDLGVALLRREGRMVRPTHACSRLLPRLREFMRLEGDLRADLRGHGMAGTVRVGAISTALGDWAAPLLRHLRATAPEVDLRLVPGTSSGLLALLEAEEIDVAVVVEPPMALPKSLRFQPLLNEPIGLLSPVRGPSDRLPYLVYSRDAWGGAVCWSALNARVHDPAVLVEMDALETIAQMVEDGVGQAVLPRWRGLSRHAPKAQFAPWPDVHRTIGLVHRLRDLDSPLLALVRDGIRGGRLDL